MFEEIWSGMRAQDSTLANNVLEPCFVFMRAQTDKSRRNINEFGEYINYREKDVGRPLLYSLMRFSIGLNIESDKLTPEELETVTQVEQNCAKHLAIVNDICSWEKELAQSKKSAQEGSVLCSAVKVMADNAGLSVDAAKRVLWSMVREWEAEHQILCQKPYMQDDRKGLYLQGLKFKMSGNESWRKTTPRYLVVD